MSGTAEQVISLLLTLSALALLSILTVFAIKFFFLNDGAGKICEKMSKKLSPEPKEVSKNLPPKPNDLELDDKLKDELEDELEGYELEDILESEDELEDIESIKIRN